MFDERSCATDADLLHHYLEDIASTPLLSATEEVDLAKRIEAGVYAAELLRHTADDALPASRRELELVARDGEHARDHMIRANLRLVLAVAKKRTRDALPLLDLIQEGNLGLIHAVEKFDYTKGYKFSTYAMWWIRQAIQRGVSQQSRTIRLPAHFAEDLAKLRTADGRLRRRLGREPEDEELADESGLPVEKIADLHRYARVTTSLDMPVGEEGDTRLVDLIEDTAAASPVTAAERSAADQELRALVGVLPEREAMVLTLRHGLADGVPCSLTEIGRRIGLSTESVRRIERQALARLRNRQHPGTPTQAA